MHHPTTMTYPLHSNSLNRRKISSVSNAGEICCSWQHWPAARVCCTCSDRRGLVSGHGNESIAKAASRVLTSRHVGSPRQTSHWSDISAATPVTSFRTAQCTSVGLTHGPHGPVQKLSLLLHRNGEPTRKSKEH